MQRDLSDSSAQRSLGEVFGHSLVGLKSLMRGLGKISPNQARISEIIDNEWNILAEPLQTVMRRFQIQGAYDIIKKATRGKELSRETYQEIVRDLNIPEEDKQRLLQLTPATYTGKAEKIALAVRYRREQ